MVDNNDPLSTHWPLCNAALFGSPFLMVKVESHVDKILSSLYMASVLASDARFVSQQFQFVQTFQVGPTKGAALGYGLVCTDYIKFLGG